MLLGFSAGVNGSRICALASVFYTSPSVVRDACRTAVVFCVANSEHSVNAKHRAHHYWRITPCATLHVDLHSARADRKPVSCCWRHLKATIMTPKWLTNVFESIHAQQTTGTRSIIDDCWCLPLVPVDWCYRYSAPANYW